jgi:DNA-binding CsgD family transcriptional regulator
MKSNRKAHPMSGLSPRQQQVLRLVLDGRTSKEIAKVLGVKPSSIYMYRSRIMRKLEVSDIPSLVRLAIRRGVIKP